MQDLGSISELGKTPGERKGYPLHYSGLGISMDSPWGLTESDMTERLNNKNKLVFEVQDLNVEWYTKVAAAIQNAIQCCPVISDGRKSHTKISTDCFFKCLAAQSCLTLFHPKDYSHQAPLSMEFSKQEYWSGLLFPSPGDLPDPGIEPESPALAGGDPPGKPLQSW